jgi:hypothetical protein
MKYILYFIIISSVIIASCTKKNIEAPIAEDEIEVPNFNCETIPIFDGLTVGWDWILSNKAYIHPQFNPNNGNEFAFVLENRKTNLTEIYTYNISTKIKTLIYTGKAHNYIQWTKDNWILFNSNVLYKIKSDGTNLTPIVKIHNVFTISEDKLLYKRAGSTPSDLMYYFSDLDNNIYDSLALNNFVTPMEWSGNKVIFLPYIYNIDTKQTTEYLQNYELANVGYKKWINESEFIWADLSNVFKTNIETNLTDTIVSHCNGFRYEGFDYSPHTNKVICHRTTKKRIDDNLLKIDSYIVLMNPDGTEMEIIDIDNAF